MQGNADINTGCTVLESECCQIDQITTGEDLSMI